MKFKDDIIKRRESLLNAVLERDNDKLTDIINGLKDPKDKDDAIMQRYPNQKSLLDISLSSLPVDFDESGDAIGHAKKYKTINTLLSGLSSDKKRVDFMTESEGRSMPPIHLVAATEPSYRLIDILVDSVEGPNKKKLLSFQNKDGDTPIHYASASNNDTFVSKVSFAIRNEVFSIENNSGELAYDIARAQKSSAIQRRDEKKAKLSEADKNSYKLVRNRGAMDRNREFVTRLMSDMYIDDEEVRTLGEIESLIKVSHPTKRKFSEVAGGNAAMDKNKVTKCYSR